MKKLGLHDPGSDDLRNRNAGWAAFRFFVGPAEKGQLSGSPVRNRLQHQVSKRMKAHGRSDYSVGSESPRNMGTSRNNNNIMNSDVLIESERWKNLWELWPRPSRTPVHSWRLLRHHSPHSGQAAWRPQAWWRHAPPCVCPRLTATSLWMSLSYHDHPVCVFILPRPPCPRVYLSAFSS